MAKTKKELLEQLEKTEELVCAVELQRCSLTPKPLTYAQERLLDDIWTRRKVDAPATT